jgi:pimeloyl-ACP methyl ester carboxylesterase
VRSPVVSADQVDTPSALEPLTAFRWFIEYGGRYGSGWSNRVVLTAAEQLPAFDPAACAPHVVVPTLFLMSPEDEMPGANSQVARAVFDRLGGPKELVEVDGGHFGIVEHPSAEFDHASRSEAEFLARVLAAG